MCVQLLSTHHLLRLFVSFNHRSFDDIHIQGLEADCALVIILFGGANFLLLLFLFDAFHGFDVVFFQEAIQDILVLIWLPFGWSNFIH